MEYPGWMLVDAETHCSSCHALVEQTWRYFPSAVKWTHALCLDCVEAMLAGDKDLGYNTGNLRKGS